jgi:hypothetical protein
MANPNYPSGAHILALIGGILIVIGGILEILAGAFLAGALGGLGIAGAFVAALGAVGLIIGLIVLYGAVQLRRRPTSAKTWGVLLIVLAIVSYVGGGGFFLGLILTLVAGVLALIWTPPAAPMTAAGQWGQPQPGTWGQPTAGGTPPPQSAPLAAAGQKFCSSCGSPNVAGATFCAKCGAPLSP